MIVDQPSGFRSVENPAANCLRIDVATVEAVRAMREAGVRPLLLKGPVIATWLYADDPARRPYRDVDLLVAVEQFDAARSVLGRLGYRFVSIPRWLHHGYLPHAECWVRHATGRRSIFIVRYIEPNASTPLASGMPRGHGRHDRRTRGPHRRAG